MLAAVGGEEESARFFIEGDDLIGDEFAGSDLILQFAVGVEQVVVSPAVALGPPDQFLAVAGKTQGLDAEPDVGAFFDERF